MTIRVRREDIPAVLYITGVGGDRPERARVILTKKGFLASLALLRRELGTNREVAAFRRYVESTLEGPALRTALDLLGEE